MSICVTNLQKLTCDQTLMKKDVFQHYIQQRFKELQWLTEDLKNFRIDELPSSSVESVEAFQ